MMKRVMILVLACAIFGLSGNEATTAGKSAQVQATPPDLAVGEMQKKNAEKLAFEASEKTLAYEGLYSHAYRFIDPPHFEVKRSANAVSYKWLVKHATGKEWRIITKEPRLDMKKTWNKLPMGTWTLSCEAADKAGRALCQAKERSLRKSPGWSGFRLAPNRTAAKMIDDAVSCLLDHRVAQDPTMPPYLFAAFEDRKVWDGPPTKVAIACYPALHGPLLINGFLDYAENRGSRKRAEECRKAAARIADYLIGVSTPATWAYPNLPISQAWGAHAQPGYKIKDTDEVGLVFVARSSSVGSALMRLWRTTGDDRYFKPARAIADTLVKTQRRDGSWPLRVNPKTGKEVEHYTANVIFCVPFLEEVADAAKSDRYHQSAAKALQWMLQNPGKTFRYEGQYEDTQETVPFGNLENWSAHFFARYLVAHRSESPAYLPLAQRIERWIEDQFIIFDLGAEAAAFGSAVPAVGEQYVNNGYPMDCHTSNWMMLCIDLYNATGNTDYRDKALAAACAITYAQCPDGACSFLMAYPANPNTPREIWYGLAGIDTTALIMLTKQPWFKAQVDVQGL